MMPTYDYVCDTCDHEMELYQSFKESPKKKCPHCGKFSLRRVISGGVGLVFKGSGFYVNDSRSKTTSENKTSHINAKDSKKTDEQKKSNIPAEKTASSNKTSSSSEAKPTKAA